jgi:NAD(P)-dependent dehydrogenase (short-subunit alcohol dehydrogenase family)
VRRSFEANVVGLLALTQACLPLLRAGRGRIVNMSSISGRFASPLLGPYAASKFAVEALSDSLRRELAPWGIPWPLVEPGKVATPIWEKSAASAQALLDGLPAEANGYYGADIEHASKRRALAPPDGHPRRGGGRRRARGLDGRGRGRATSSAATPGSAPSWRAGCPIASSTPTPATRTSTAERDG